MSTKNFLKVVEIDDNSVMREMVGGIVERSGERVGVGVEIMEADSGVMGYQYAVSSQAHLVLTDVNMPGGNGPEYARKILDASDSSFVAILTGGNLSAEDAELISGLLKNPRVLGLFGKPINPMDIEALVRVASVRSGLVGVGTGALEEEWEGLVDGLSASVRRACCLNGVTYRE